LKKRGKMRLDFTLNENIILGVENMKIRQDAWSEENDLLLAETVLRHVREGSTQLNAFEEVGDKLNRTSAACGFRWNAVVRHQYEKALDLAKKQRKQRQRILGKDQGGKKKLLYTPPEVTVEDFEPVQGFDTSFNSSFDANFETIMQDSEFELEADSGAGMTASPTTGFNLGTGTGIAGAPSNGLAPNTEQNSFGNEFANEVSMVPIARTAPNKGLTLDTVITYLQTLNHSNLHVDILKIENERLKREITDLKKHNQELKGKIDHLEKNSDIMQEDYETLMKIMNRARKLVVLEEDERPQTSFKMDRNGNLEKIAE
jgi:prespore-specific regulator